MTSEFVQFDIEPLFSYTRSAAPNILQILSDSKLLEVNIADSINFE